MSEKTVKSGDVVRLRSGGPTMTAVGPVCPGQVINLTWFTDDGELRHGVVDNAGMLDIEAPST